MKLIRYITEIAERLMPDNRPEDFAAPFVVLLRELAKGRPISPTTLAITLGWPAERVDAVLEQAASTEYEHDGNIVGYGLTLRETAHAVEIGGRRLYAWCALGTLMLPVLIGQRPASRRTAPKPEHPFRLRSRQTRYRMSNRSTRQCHGYFHR